MVSRDLYTVRRIKNEDWNDQIRDEEIKEGWRGYSENNSSS